MMNKIITSLVLIIMISLEVSAQYVNMRSGSPVVVDGIVSPMEWDDADSVLITISTGVEVTVKFKHDGSNFNFAFMGNLESSNIRFPEILFDIDNDKSASWTNDWWFHVSATDCESNTAANDYSNCNAVQPDWTAESNFNTGPPTTDTVEIQIPFAKVGFTSTQTDTIGIAFDVTNTFNAWNYWPSGATNSDPSTWGNAIVEFPVGIQEDDVLNKISVYPNPVTESFIVDFQSNFNSDPDLKILNILGEEIKKIKWMDNGFISTSDLAQGIYFIELTDGESKSIIRIVKQ